MLRSEYFEKRYISKNIIEYFVKRYSRITIFSGMKIVRLKNVIQHFTFIVKVLKQRRKV